MATANDIIKAAFRIAGVTVKGESPDADETQDALETLNDLLESISNDSLFVYGRTVESFSLTSGQIEYTIGSGGDFNTTRPTDIVSAYVRQANTDYDLGIITDEDYAAITVKNTGGQPYYLNYNATYPLGTIKLYPAPAAGYTLYMVTEKPLSTFTLNETVSLPSGWNRYLKNQLALEICAEYGVQPPQTAVEIAFDAMAQIKRAAARVKSMDAIPYTPTGNVYTGWYH